MDPHIHIRTAASGNYEPEWLKVIWACNDISREWSPTGGDDLSTRMFGAPEIGPWWAGGTVEEYPDARVIHRGDETVSIVGKTERGDAALARAAASLGIHTNQTVYALVMEEENDDSVSRDLP